MKGSKKGEQESWEFNCNKGSERSRLRMSSNNVEDEDLIDLEGAGGSCVSRGAVPEASAEELEHLLDVCPPQLEQKLSLTRKQELVREHNDNGDVLVTLGHDQVVPRRKRIDVVSSETIKRVRDITKNLEPVIRTSLSSRLENGKSNRLSEDNVDGTPNSAHSQDCQDRLDVTYETQAINSAFDFLANLEDVEDDDPPPVKWRRRDSSCKEDKYETQAISTAFNFLADLEDDKDDDPPPEKRRQRDSNSEDEDYDISGDKGFYPLEPTCLIRKESSRYRNIERANRDIEANDRTSVIDPVDSDERTENNNENGGFEVSPLSKKSQEKELDSREVTTLPANFVFERKPRFARLWDDYASITRGAIARRAEDRLERKSWSGEGTRRFTDCSKNRDIEANDRTSVVNPVNSDERTQSNNKKPGLEVSPLSKRSQKNKLDSSEVTTFPANFVFERKPSFTRLWDDYAAIRQGAIARRAEDRLKRKSWSEEGTRGLTDGSKNSDSFVRLTSIEIESFICQPSTSGITALLLWPSKDITRRPEVQSASSSECSEVDWSWVEEYESPAVETTPSTSGNVHRSCSRKSNISGGGGSRAACPSVRPASAPTRVAAAGTPTTVSSSETTSFSNNADGERERMRTGGYLARDSNGSVAMSVGATGKSPSSGTTPGPLSLSCELGVGDTASIDYETAINLSSANGASVLNGNLINCSGNVAVGAGATPRSSERNSSNNNNNRVNEAAPRATNSWVRASMRRIRHLRLPDAERRNADANSTASAPILSAPNSLPDIALIAPEILAAHTNGTATGNGLRPSSAPVASRDHTGQSPPGNAATPRRGGRHGRSSRGGRSQERASRARSGARANNPNGDNAEIGVQTGSSAATSPAGRRTASGPPQHPSSPGAASAATRRVCERQRDADRDNERGEDDDEDECPLGRWPHPLSPALACLGCTLGLFNISRFAILSIQFGANFIVQFLVLSLVLGIPLLTLQVCLGQRLAAGALDMWRISPVFHGVGIALLVAQAFIGIYSIIGVSWMFVYFRDSFITKQDRYRWAEPFLLYRDDTRLLHNTTTYKLHETVPDYFSGVVLQRHHLNEPEPGVVTLKFQVAFNLAVVWMIVFVSLSKGLRSYGKVVYVFTLVPVFGTLILCTKLLGLTPPGSIHQLFPATVWSEFFINSKSWVAASSEVFLTWGLLGAAAMQVAAHNKHKHLLQRDTSLVVVLTLVVLLLAAFLANTCVQILRHYGYHYTTSSFEKMSGYTFMRHVNQPLPSGYSSTPERFMSHASFLLGQRVVRPGADLSAESGYQVLRLATELVPATLAILGTEQVSPFWAVLFYFILILFGIAQQLAIWHCVITGIMAINTKMMKLWETTITFFSCACAYILGLPMATELGICVVYYLDYTVGGAWWIMILYLVQVGAVFVVRGRPHTGETVVAELFPPTGRCLRHWAGPLLSFTWNVVLPVALMVLSITVFKSSSFRELYVYRRTSRDYWSVWARQLGAAIQLTPILIIPGVAIIQTCRYLNNGPSDIFDRIQLLYRPPLDTDDSGSSQTQYGNETSTSIHGNGVLPSSTDVPFEDPPPKYTPPPSYTTATGARIAKMLRQSFRRSVRRIASVLGESSAPRTRPALQPPPPDYATVLVEMNQTILSQNITIEAPEPPQPDVTDTARPRALSADRHRPNTIDRMTRISTIDRSSVERTHSTMDRGRRAYSNSGTSNLTAADVANLLRSSIRRGTSRTQQNLCGSSIHDPTTGTAASVENLVNAAAPIGEDSLVFAKDVPLVHEDENDDDDEKKTVNEMDNSVSVI